MKKAVLLVALLFASLMLVPSVSVKAMNDERDTVLAYDMEQLYILPDGVALSQQPAGMVQGSYLLDGSPYRNTGELLPYTMYSLNTSGYTGPSKVVGQYGYALSFDGVNDYVQVPHASSLSLSDHDFTLEAWIYPRNASEDFYILDKYQADGWRFYVISNGTDLALGFGYFYDGVHYWVTSSYGDIEIDSWQHVAVTMKASAISYDFTLYVNGNIVKTQGEGYISFTTSQPLTLGFSAYFWKFSDGIIDEVRIYPSTLTQVEIVSDSNTPIQVYKQHQIPYFYDNVNGWDSSPTNAKQTFKENDAFLPCVERDGTYTQNVIMQRVFIPGFQQYRFRATFNITEDSGFNTANSFTWSAYLFKDGVYQAKYFLRLYKQPATAGSGTKWTATIWQQLNGHAATSPGSSGLDFIVSPNNVQVDTWQFIIDIWTTPDGKQLAMRCTSENATQQQDVYTVSYYFDLADKDGTPRYIEWFDGCVLLDFVTSTYGYNGFVKVESHRIDIVASIVQFFQGIGERIQNLINPATKIVEPTFIPVVTEVVKLIPKVEVPSISIPQAITDALEGWQRAILDIPAKLYEGVTGLAKSIGDTLALPLRAISTAFGNLPQAMWQSILGALNYLGAAIRSIFDAVGLGWVFDSIGTTISNFSSWFVTSVSAIPIVLGQFFLGVVAWLGIITSYFVSFIDTLASVFAYLVWIWESSLPYWSWVPSVLTALLPLILLAYAFWLFSPLWTKGSIRYGLEESFARINMTIGYLYRIIMLLWHVVDFIIDTVSRLIEATPIVE
jgi:hypothetical protein